MAIKPMPMGDSPNNERVGSIKASTPAVNAPEGMAIRNARIIAHGRTIACGTVPNLLLSPTSSVNHRLCRSELHGGCG